MAVPAHYRHECPGSESHILKTSAVRNLAHQRPRAAFLGPALSSVAQTIERASLASAAGFGLLSRATTRRDYPLPPRHSYTTKGYSLERGRRRELARMKRNSGSLIIPTANM
jgi:hypothetical protein